MICTPGCGLCAVTGNETMSEILDDLLQHLELERLEVNLFRGQSRDIGSPRVFGGQVLAQALKAALGTVHKREVHSLHAYFLRPGDINAPIIYDVDRARDGMSFSMRRVVAIQHGHQIFNLSASFQKSEEGLEHQIAMPQVEQPEALHTTQELARKLSPSAPERVRDFLTRERPIEFRFVEPQDYNDPQPVSPHKHVWFKAVDSLPDDEGMHRVLLAYASDFHLITTVANPHAIAFGQGKLQLASLDHAMWFHRPARMDDWLLYAIDSPSSSHARGFARGNIFTRDGHLVASTAQEGLIRMWSKAHGSRNVPAAEGSR